MILAVVVIEDDEVADGDELSGGKSRVWGVLQWLLVVIESWFGKDLVGRW